MILDKNQSALPYALVWLNVVLLQLVPHGADNQSHNSRKAGLGVVVRRGGLTAQVGGLHCKALAEQFRAANLLFLRELVGLRTNNIAEAMLKLLGKK